MKIVFVSNYFNHHQRPLSEALYSLTGGEFIFIETGKMREDRKKLGYGEENIPGYVLQCFGGEEMHRRCGALIDAADLVIAGSAPQVLLRSRIRAGRPVLRYSERLCKEGLSPLRYIPRLLRLHCWNPPGKPIYLLCAGAYTAGDYGKFGLFRKRAFRWGYFPEMKTYDLPRLMAGKDATRILWAGRFLDWKHPDDALAVAVRLRSAGCRFHMELVGTGEMESALREQIASLGLEDCVSMPGSMPPGEVRRRMEGAGIFLFTSDRREGWGAVLNEAMNSGCAVVASHAAGSVPTLLRHGENGLVYPCADVESLYLRVRQLLENPALQRELGSNACRTITEEWNAPEAARRLISLGERIMAGEDPGNLYAAGLCSRDSGIQENWYA